MFLQIVGKLGEARDRVQVVPSIGQHDNALFLRGHEWSLYFTDGGAGREDLVLFGELDGWRVLRHAHDPNRQGADAVDVWEMGNAPVRLDRWNALKRIGDRQLLTASLAPESAISWTTLSAGLHLAELSVKFNQPAGSADFEEEQLIDSARAR